MNNAQMPDRQIPVSDELTTVSALSDTELNEKISEYSGYAVECSKIDTELYTKYEVKRGLRDISGKGVLAGLTEISEILSYVIEDGDLVPCDGKLFCKSGFHAIVIRYFEILDFQIPFYNKIKGRGLHPSYIDTRMVFNTLHPAHAHPHNPVCFFLANFAFYDVRKLFFRAQVCHCLFDSFFLRCGFYFIILRS